MPNIKLELVVTDEQLEAAVKAIAKPGETGRNGGEEIFVSTIELAA
jgi:nitrogen regulatory protein PII